MRQMLVRVPRGHGDRAFEILGRHGGETMIRLEATAGRDAMDVVVAHLPNYRLEAALDDLKALPDLHVAFQPAGVLVLQPPAGEIAEDVREVSDRSPVEVYLGGHQSVGSWRGFLGYAAAAGVVAWIGMLTNTVFLLVAAMLLAPFASPAMNLAIATARGDAHLAARSLGRYGAALAVSVATAAALTALARQEVATAQMTAVGDVSAVAYLLPLVAGAAGALSLVQAARASLVSGAAIGMLVAASLAPPAALLGMAPPLGEWGMARSAAFLLALQLVGINLAGAAVFRAYGLAPAGARYPHGRPGVARAVASLTALAFVGLVGWQFAHPPELQRATRAQRAIAAIHEAVRADGRADLIRAEAQFVRADLPGRPALLCAVHVARRSDEPPDLVRARLATAIQARILAADLVARPFVEVVVLDAPAAANE